MNTSFFPPEHPFNSDPFFTHAAPQRMPARADVSASGRFSPQHEACSARDAIFSDRVLHLLPDGHGAKSPGQSPRASVLPAKKPSFGVGFRHATTLVLGEPVAAVRQAVLAIARPIAFGMANLMGLVLGTSLGIVGGGVGAVAGLLTHLAPVNGAKDGFSKVFRAVNATAHGIAIAAVMIIGLTLTLLEMMACALGWAVGAVVTSPLALVGRF